jgi:hypothetical protein
MLNQLNLPNLQSAITRGKTKWLQDFLAENLPSLFLTSTNYQTWLDDFLHTLESKQLIKPSQQKNYLTDVRNAIKVIDPDHPALQVIKFSRETWVEINQADRDRIAERSTKLIDHPDAIVSQAIELVKTNNWSDIAAGLAVLTGRRCGEIIQTAQFESKTKYSVTFRGALKRKDEAVELVFEIPVLCQADLIIESIERLRLQLGDEVKTLSINQVNQRYEERVAQKCDRHFSTLVPKRDGKDNLYSHLFRAIYATIACYWYCPPTVPEMEYRAAIQGHYQLLKEKDDQLRRSLAASRHYFDYKIADGSGNIDGRLGIKLGQPGVQVIAQFRDFKQKIRNTKESKVKIQQHQQIMQEQSNSVPEGVVSLQLSFSFSKLEKFSQVLNLSSTETVNTLIDWAEAAINSAQYLEIENPTPATFTSKIKSIDQDYQTLINKSPEPSFEFVSKAQSGSSPVDQHRIMNTICSLSEYLSQTLIQEQATNPELSINPVHDLAKLARLNTSQSQDVITSNNLDQSNQDQKAQAIHTKKRQRDTPEIMVQDINRAIDALIEFNNAPNRPHRQKIRISIKPIVDLTGRATNSISKVLKDRSEEINRHHEQHQIDSYHNKSRRDETSKDYPNVESEPDINYQKLTETTQ